jgi:hypothetical protein
MDVATLSGGSDLWQEREPAIEYTAQVTSVPAQGEAKLSIDKSSLIISTLFDTLAVPFAEMNVLELRDYAVLIRTDGGEYSFSRMGTWCQPFYEALLGAYNEAVLRALFVSGEPELVAKGEYRYTESHGTANGSAPARVYANSMVILPPDLGARRVPLCFTTTVQESGYELTLTVDTGESYTLAKLGFDTAPFAATLGRQIRAIHERALATVKEIDSSLTYEQASRIARLMPEGAAAPVGLLAGIAPSFVEAFEAELAQTRAAESYPVFKRLDDSSRMWVGSRRNEDPHLLWLIAPSPDGRFAAVEFAEENNATFIYRTDGDFEAFARQLNHALEAIGFKREVIRLTDDELLEPENADYYMAVKRTAALQFIRNRFKSRIIHSNPAAWEKTLLEQLEVTDG